MNPAVIPFYPQINPYACGAACLQMAYESLGIIREQAQIWASVQTFPYRSGAPMQRMVQHAIGVGLDAMTIQARDPWTAAIHCANAGIRLIVNQRPNPDASIGHFTLLANAADDEAVLFDPMFGMPRTVTKSQMLGMWTSRTGDRNPGSMLIALRRPDMLAHRCAGCLAPLRMECKCPGCLQTVRLAPPSILQCTEGCERRNWKTVYCPHCDSGMAKLCDDPHDPSHHFESLGFRNALTKGV